MPQRHHLKETRLVMVGIIWFRNENTLIVVFQNFKRTTYSTPIRSKQKDHLESELFQIIWSKFLHVSWAFITLWYIFVDKIIENALALGRCQDATAGEAAGGGQEEHQSTKEWRFTATQLQGCLWCNKTQHIRRSKLFAHEVFIALHFVHLLLKMQAQVFGQPTLAVDAWTWQRSFNSTILKIRL